jgi:geranylgeranyl diphosphate synthase, type II
MAETAASLDRTRRRFEEALSQALPAESDWPDTLHRAMRYSLFAGGKRIRPLLVLAAAEAVGGREEDALPFACAVEMIHTYSLIHDDLPCMDDDDLRRGKPTSHKVFGEAIAILAGDALLTRAFHLLAELGSTDEATPSPSDDAPARRRLAALALLGAAAGSQGLVGGQVLDLESTGQEIHARTLERLHRAKTGALLAACVRGGALLGGGGRDDLERLERYGSAIGLGFQVVDDVLDATGDAQELGKTAGKDQDARKATYVRLFGVERARRFATELLEEAEQAIARFGPQADRLRELARLIVERRA